VLALEFIDRRADHALSTAASATAWLGNRRIRSALPAGSEPALANLRTAVDDLLRAAAGGGEPSAEALDRVNAASAAAPVAEQLDWPSRSQPRTWLAATATPEQHVHALIARSAIALVAGDAPGTLRECRAHGCARLFLATNSRRMWCSTACGNRVRVARHAARGRETQGGSFDQRLR
jgi:predicted RNA-binding Zn ribbon-like protein